MNKRSVGSEKEELGAEFLANKGYRIIEKNFYIRQAEIDIVAYDEVRKILIFVEVKYRSSAKSGSSLEAVSLAKQRKVSKAALYYLNYKKINPDTVNIRFDVVGIDGDKITHIENAFMYVG